VTSSSSTSRFPLPSTIGAILDTNLDDCQNLNLLLHKYVPREVIEADEKKGEKRLGWLKQLTRKTSYDLKLRREWYARWDRIICAHGATPFHMQCGWRMVIGLGGASPVETDLLTHWVYGIPYIPGSAVKGLTRAYAAAESLAEGGKWDEDIKRIFGTDKQTGGVIFFDAIPFSDIKFNVDIMNPHYPGYYGGDDTAPSNDQNPIPIYFLAIEETMFSFALAARTKASSSDDMKQAEGWLKDALRVMGIGAKTSAGYGHFESANY